jgi:hypothetical protein
LLVHGRPLTPNPGEILDSAGFRVAAACEYGV